MRIRNLLTIKITDELTKQPIIDIKGDTRTIKEALDIIRIKYGGKK